MNGEASSGADLTPKNARGRAVTRLCLALETYRRTDEGRVRDAKALLSHFFPQDKHGSKDRLFSHMPKEVRADLLSSWGIRGKKSALRDDDEKVRLTVTDALAAGDIDAPIVEEGVTAEILVDWIPLTDWWAFWRGAALPLNAVRRALATARELQLFDERWFLSHLALPNQKLEGTDVVCSALSKEQVMAWVNAVHASGDASPSGLVKAIGWETILAKTAHDALLHALDALARHVGLVEAPTPSSSAGPNSSLTSPMAHSAQAPFPAPPASRPATSAPLPKPSEPRLQSVKAPVVPPPIPLESSSMSKPPKSGKGPPPLQPALAAAAAARAAATGKADLPGESAPPAPPSTPVSVPPNPRILFGTGAATGALGPMRPPARTLAGVGEAGPTLDGDATEIAIAMPPPEAAAGDPTWAPPRAEPGDMGWDIVNGVRRSMQTNVAPKYNFEQDDEPTSDISLPGENVPR